jgi:glycosyltransferase involved in cell wall biosynthesis
MPVKQAPISVVIPSYNCGRHLCEAIASVLRQSLPPRQIIVIDDGSSDDTAQQVRPYLDRVTYIRQENRGVSAARNRGIAEAREAFIAFLDADDVWHRQKTALQMRLFQERPELGILSTPTYDWPKDVEPVVEPPVGELPVQSVTWEQVVVRNRINTSSVIVRRDVLVRAGPFDEAMQGPEDRDLWLRILELAPGASLQIPLSGYRITPGGISQNAGKCRDGMLRILRKLSDRGVWRGRPMLRRRAHAYVNHTCAYLYSAGGDQWMALACAVKSLAWYPLAFPDCDELEPFERLRRAAVIALRAVRLKGTDRLPAAFETAPSPVESPCAAS